MFKKRTVKGNTRTKPIRRGSESSSSDSDTDSESNVVIKKQKTDRITTPTVIPATETKLTKNDAITRVDTLAQEIIDKERQEKESKQNTDEEAPSASGDGLYKGQKGYAEFIKPSSKMGKIGPKKQSSNIKSTTVFDFQRDICKDYKQTGFCGYGDSCKFLHARDDFKAGWKLNRDWDLNAKDKERLEQDLESIPFKCVICKEDYKSPVKTNCGHYFCEKCFLQRLKKSRTCFICSKDTNGVALPAKNLKQLLRNE